MQVAMAVANTLSYFGGLRRLYWQRSDIDVRDNDNQDFGCLLFIL